jgi:catechol 2,3-dioxygenase-like lactoylglutathione lyase family enzyme
VIDVQKVDFVSVPIRNPQAARGFYGEILGLPPSPHNPYEFETPDGNVLILHRRYVPIGG